MFQKFSGLVVVVADEKGYTCNGKNKLESNDEDIVHNGIYFFKSLKNLEKGGGVVFTTDRPLGTYIIIHVCA